MKLGEFLRRMAPEFGTRHGGQVRGRIHKISIIAGGEVSIVLRFGLDGSSGRTLEQVGVELGITRERVRQLETRALRELRHVAPALELYLRT